MRRKWSLILLCLLSAACVHAQTAVPYLATGDRFGVFRAGVFIPLEKHRPLATWPMGDRLAYATRDGRLMLFMDGQVSTLTTGLPADSAALREQVKASRTMIAWRQGPTLQVTRTDRPIGLGREVGAFSVHDSLVVFHDLADGVLNVYWKGRSFPVADVARTAEAPQWKAGANTLVFHDRSTRKLHLCYRGELTVLCDSADYALVSPGMDVVAYMDEASGVFRIFHAGRKREVEQLRPARFVAGDGHVAYLSATGAFRQYTVDGVRELARSFPTDLFVQDSVVTWVDKGKWYTVNSSGVEIIEPYVPESWQVRGSTILYPDLDRELRTYRLGQRTVVDRASDLRSYLLLEDAVVRSGRDGTVRVRWAGQVYEAP